MKRYRVHITVGKNKFVANTLANSPAEAQVNAMAHVNVTKVEEAPAETIEQDPATIWDRFDELFDKAEKAFTRKTQG